jgi:hypothetical protein
LRRLTVRLEARLRGRGVAAERVQVVVKHDRATARPRGVAPVTEFALKLTVPPLASAGFRSHVRRVAARGLLADAT